MPSKRPIPQVPRTATEHGRVQFDSAIKENLEVITGQRVALIKPLTNDASMASVIAKINEIIERLQ